jgi:hypothetical protein
VGCQEAPGFVSILPNGSHGEAGVGADLEGSARGLRNVPKPVDDNNFAGQTGSGTVFSPELAAARPTI